MLVVLHRQRVYIPLAGLSDTAADLAADLATDTVADTADTAADQSGPDPVHIALGVRRRHVLRLKHVLYLLVLPLLRQRRRRWHVWVMQQPHLPDSATDHAANPAAADPAAKLRYKHLGGPWRHHLCSPYRHLHRLPAGWHRRPPRRRHRHGRRQLHRL